MALISTTAGPEVALDALERSMDSLGEVAVAVSGGVDSMVLAVVAGFRLGDRAEMFHAVSPAVPPEATYRVRRYASRRGWRLRVVDAGEFADEDYLRNPHDRCYFCKSNLYGTIAAQAGGVILAGTTTDDLDDVRPGLAAAAEHGVRHPYVEAGIAKATVRAVAREIGLTDVAELPAAPCLASRIETGIAIRPRQLTMVHRVEQAVSRRLAPGTVRCRVRSRGVVVELDEARLARLSAAERSWVVAEVEALLGEFDHPGPVLVEPYWTGSAVLVEEPGHG